jgi:radical SAM superfamily enzyme YgiQ (UPF0313 family)
VKKVLVSSGIRMDLAREDDEYVEELVRHHVGGHLKVAPEHTSDAVLALMKKPPQHTFEEFAEKFERATERAGKEQYLVPYFIASHPGSTVKEMIDLALFLKSSGYRPRQVQDFIPAPMDVATCMYHTGLDPMTMRPVPVVKRLKERVAQRALMQFFEPENWFAVRRALLDAGRGDLIGDGPQCLIPARPPREALEARARAMPSPAERDDASGEPAADSTYVHARDAGTSATVGYRPHRPGARRRRPERP